MPELTRSGPTNYRHDCENIRPQGLQCNLGLQRLKANQPSSPQKKKINLAPGSS
jgi:hypothetical protein